MSKEDKKLKKSDYNKSKEETSDVSKSPTNESSSAELVQIQEELEHVNPTIFKGLDPNKKGEILRTVTKVTMQKHSGPIPDPETLRQYNSVIPDAADRILTMAEKQQDHRMGLEKLAVKSQLTQSRNGQYFGLFIALCCIAASVYLGMNGHETLAGVIGTSTIIPLAIIFVLRKLPKSTNSTSVSKKSES